MWRSFQVKAVIKSVVSCVHNCIVSYQLFCRKIQRLKQAGEVLRDKFCRGSNFPWFALHPREWFQRDPPEGASPCRPQFWEPNREGTRELNLWPRLLRSWTRKNQPSELPLGAKESPKLYRIKLLYSKGHQSF